MRSSTATAAGRPKPGRQSKPLEHLQTRPRRARLLGDPGWFWIGLQRRHDEPMSQCARRNDLHPRLTVPIALNPAINFLAGIIKKRFSAPLAESSMLRFVAIELPPAAAKNWAARRKAAVVEAARIGMISVQEACLGYNRLSRSFPPGSRRSSGTASPAFGPPRRG